jgi:hypothetical protein
VPTPSAGPPASPVAAPTASLPPSLRSGDPPTPVEAAAAACEAILSAGALAAATGQSAVLISAAPLSNRGLPPSDQCGYRLAGGTTISLTARWEITAGPNRSSASATWGPSAGGTPVRGLPAPAYTTVFSDGRRALAWTPSIGPALTLVLDAEAWLPDGTAAGVDVLTTVALAATDGGASQTTDPACARLLPVKAAWSQSWSPGPGEIVCGYVLPGGTAVTVETAQRAPGHLPSCCQRVPQLGRGARARTLPGRRNPGWRIDWVIRGGSRVLTGTIRNAVTARERIGKEGLTLLAARVGTRHPSTTHYRPRSRTGHGARRGR